MQLQFTCKPTIAAAGLLLLAAAAVVSAQPGAAANRTLTAVPGIKVGHYTLPQRPTGCTVILVEAGAVAAVDVRGGAPATHETDLLDPVKTVQEIYGLAFSGGSTFGLESAAGVLRYLEERNIGFVFGDMRIPIVPGASIFDLRPRLGDPKIRPGADCGYRAARAASTMPVSEGSVGAGAGATLGHLAGDARAMKSGVGSGAVTINGLIVGALAVVNPFGDVIDPATGRVVAGVRTPDGKRLADARLLLRAGSRTPRGRQGGNSIIGVVATNARLTKAQAARVAQMAHDGMARAVWPVHTPVDGDTIFSIATGSKADGIDLTTVGALAADAVANAIVRAATQATSVPAFPALRDLR